MLFWRSMNKQILAEISTVQASSQPICEEVEGLDVNFKDRNQHREKFAHSH